jgi:hypothetical protein
MAKSHRQRHCQYDSSTTSPHGQVTSAMTLRLDQHRLGSAVTSRTQQRYRQQNSAAPSPAWLGSSVASITWPLHRTMAKSPRQPRHQYDSTTLSPAWLDNYIAPWPSYLDSAVTSMTRWNHRQHDSASILRHDQAIMAAPSPTWLGSTVASMTRQGHHATAWSSTSIIYNFNGKQTRC